MDFETLKQEMDTLNHINPKAEFCYTIVFWKKGNPSEKYHIGVCIRGLPICKPGV